MKAASITVKKQNLTYRTTSAKVTLVRVKEIVTLTTEECKEEAKKTSEYDKLNHRLSNKRNKSMQNFTESLILAQDERWRHA